VGGTPITTIGAGGAIVMQSDPQEEFLQPTARLA
jgi:anthranilate/para-aminobenzoate synthase component I